MEASNVELVHVAFSLPLGNQNVTSDTWPSLIQTKARESVVCEIESYVACVYLQTCTVPRSSVEGGLPAIWSTSCGVLPITRLRKSSRVYRPEGCDDGARDADAA